MDCKIHYHFSLLTREVMIKVVSLSIFLEWSSLILWILQEFPLIHYMCIPLTFYVSSTTQLCWLLASCQLLKNHFYLFRSSQTKSCWESWHCFTLCCILWNQLVSICISASASHLSDKILAPHLTQMYSALKTKCNAWVNHAVLEMCLWLR